MGWGDEGPTHTSARAALRRACHPPSPPTVAAVAAPARRRDPAAQLPEMSLHEEDEEFDRSLQEEPQLSLFDGGDDDESSADEAEEGGDKKGDEDESSEDEA